MSESYTIEHGTQEEAVEFFLSLSIMQNIVYVPENDEWFKYCDGFWKPISQWAISSVIAQLLPSLEKTLLGKPMERRLWAKTIRSNSFRTAVIQLLKAHVICSSNKFNCNPFLLNFTNGTYNLKTKELQAFNRVDFITHQVPYKYTPGETCEKWEKFLSDILPMDIVKYLQTFFGLCLSGEIVQKVHFFWGEGANGKSVLLKIVEKLLQPYVCHLPSQTLIRYRSDGPRPQSEIVALKGARLAVASEIEEGKLNEATIKYLTSSDTVTARGVYDKKFTSFMPTHKLVISGNNEPYVSGVDNGIWRRVIKVPFEVKIAESKQVEFNTLVSSILEEAPGILNWLLQGWTMYREQGLHCPESLIAVNKEYREEQDTLGQFIMERCIKGEEKEVPSSMFLQTFNQWSSSQGGNSWNAKTFSSRLRHKGYNKKKKSQGVYWVGLTLKPDLLGVVL